MEYKYSIDEEFYPYDSIEEAILGHYDETGEYLDKIHRGVPISYNISHFMPSADWLVECIVDNAYQEASEFAEGWADKFESFQKSFYESICKVTEEFCTEYECHPDFFTIEKAQEASLKVTEIEPELVYKITSEWV